MHEKMVSLEKLELLRVLIDLYMEQNIRILSTIRASNLKPMEENTLL